jgi:hypothetical protein
MGFVVWHLIQFTREPFRRRLKQLLCASRASNINRDADMSLKQRLQAFVAITPPLPDD